jgi:hypothetical protein
MTMSFWDKLESNRDGIEDTVEFTIRTAVVTLACVVLVVVAALVIGLFVPDTVVDSDKVFEIVGPAFNMVIGAFVGLLGGLSINANARDKKPEEPLELTEVAPEPDAPEPVGKTIAEASCIHGVRTGHPCADCASVGPEVAQQVDDDDDDLAPWEKYRNDLRYDANGDGVVDEDDFPDWRNPAA